MDDLAAFLDASLTWTSSPLAGQGDPLCPLALDRAERAAAAHTPIETARITASIRKSICRRSSAASPAILFNRIAELLPGKMAKH
jgi:hypothetical protein